MVGCYWWERKNLLSSWNTWAHGILKPGRIMNLMPFCLETTIYSWTVLLRCTGTLNSKLSNWARVCSFPLCAQLGFGSFLPWEMNLGGGAAVEGDYRPLSSKPWEETCCTTGYRKTANHRPVIRIHTVNWFTASGGKPVKPVGKGMLQRPTQTQHVTHSFLKDK